jgi:uncharacterized linocin/CFP29 family protein
MAVDPTKTTPPANIEPGDVEETGVVEQKTRIQKVKEEHQKRANERANNQNELKVSYKKIMNEPAFKDILVKGKQFAAYHLTLAKDGVGYQQTGSKDDSGNAVQQTVFFSHEKRVTELDKAAGIEELSSYIERQISEEALNPSAPKKIVS